MSFENPEKSFLQVQPGNRFCSTEITYNRIKSAILRRVADFPHWIAWNVRSDIVKENQGRLHLYEGSHIGKRCFIMANGPSLGQMDLSLLKDEKTIGMNRIYLLFDKLDFQPSYYVCMNELVLDQFASDIRNLTMHKFLNWSKRNLFPQTDPYTNFLYSLLALSDQFTTDISRPISSGGTVTYVALQVAYYLGFHEVILIGLDHNFTDKGIPNAVEMRNQLEDKNHFHPDYFPKGTKWQLPDLRRSELSYELARKAFEKDGRRILDATIGGKCTVFEKVDYNSLF